jgi:hypothetical protein
VANPFNPAVEPLDHPPPSRAFSHPSAWENWSPIPRLPLSWRSTRPGPSRSMNSDPRSSGMSRRSRPERPLMELRDSSALRGGG